MDGDAQIVLPAIMSCPAVLLRPPFCHAGLSCHARYGHHRCLLHESECPRLGAVMVHTVDSARLDMPVPLQRLQAHVYCVECRA